MSNPEEQQQDTGQPVSDLSRTDQINQISQILGNSPDELAAMSDDEICRKASEIL